MRLFIEHSQINIRFLIKNGSGEILRNETSYKKSIKNRSETEVESSNENNWI